MPIPPATVSFAGTETVADVVPVITLASGALQIPDDPGLLGWWAAGASPGQSEGTIVLVGHMDGLRHSGAMSVLLDVEAGQTVDIQDRMGQGHEYRITARDTAPRTTLDPDLFNPGGPHRLVLITCGGTYDERSGQYTDNIVVTAELVTDGT